MDPYNHDAIQNQFDIRLVDCFLKQNKNNEWLSPITVACWMFETNSPTALQLSYCQRKISSIIGMVWTSDADRSFLEKGKPKDSPFTYVYRLKQKDCSGTARGTLSRSIGESDVKVVFTSANCK